MLVFAFTESHHIGAPIAAALKTMLAPLEERDFVDGEYKIRPMRDVRGEDVYVVQSLFKDADYTVHDKLVRLLFLIATLRDHGAQRVTAVVPYMAYGRKDRRTKPHDPLSLRYIAQMFEAVGCDCLLTLEAHNLMAFQNAFRCQTIHLECGQVFVERVASRYADDNLVVISPDPGGVKRAQLFREALADRMSRPIGFGFVEKRRSNDVMTSGAFVGDVSGATVLIVDDIIASGQTTISAAQTCLDHGANKVSAIAAHGIFTPGAETLFARDTVHRVFVTDSITTDRFAVDDGPEYVSAAPAIAETILRLAGSEQ